MGKSLWAYVPSVILPICHTKEVVDLIITMFGTFQQSHLRIEVPASEISLQESLTYPAKLQQWLFPLQLERGLPDQLHVGLTYTSTIGAIAIQHTVDQLEPNCLRLLLSKGIDGCHEWSWGEGWIQSRLEGISLLPLNLAQTASLLRLRQFLTITNA